MTTRSGAIYNLANSSPSPLPTQTTILPKTSYKKRDRYPPLFKKSVEIKPTYKTEDEEVQKYTDAMFCSIPPKYEVNIDFDEASEAWRANKRRVGESWAYVKPSVYVKPTQTMVTRSSSRNKM